MEQKSALPLRSLLFEISLAGIQELLAGRGIPILVLKGPHVAAVLYERPQERSYCDLDLLVRPRQYHQAARLLLEKGFILLRTGRRRLASEKADYQMLLRSPRGIAVELHRALADTSQFRSDVEGFFERSEEFAFGELKCRGLGSEDLLLHLCLHFGKRHFLTSEKKHLQDIALLLGKRVIDWPVFIERTKMAGCTIISHFSLMAAAIHYRAEIPEEVALKLRPTRLRRIFLRKIFDPASFPAYRFHDRSPGFRDRIANLLLVDRMHTMIFSTLFYLGRTAMDKVLGCRLFRPVLSPGSDLDSGND